MHDWSCVLEAVTMRSGRRVPVRRTTGRRRQPRTITTGSYRQDRQCRAIADRNCDSADSVAVRIGQAADKPSDRSALVTPHRTPSSHEPSCSPAPFTPLVEADAPPAKAGAQGEGGLRSPVARDIGPDDEAAGPREQRRTEEQPTPVTGPPCHGGRSGNEQHSARPVPRREAQPVQEAPHGGQWQQRCAGEDHRPKHVLPERATRDRSAIEPVRRRCEHLSHHADEAEQPDADRQAQPKPQDLSAPHHIVSLRVSSGNPAGDQIVHRDDWRRLRPLPP